MRYLFALKKVFLIVFIIIFILTLNIFPKSSVKYDSYSSNESIYVLDNNNFVSKINSYVSYSSDIQFIITVFNLSKIDSDIRNGFFGYFPKKLDIVNVLFKDDLSVVFNDEVKYITYEQLLLYLSIFSASIHEKYNDIVIRYYNEDELIISSDELDGFNLISYGKNINSSYILYNASYDNYSYYVPVIKYYDDNRSKIEVIIDEINSSSTYDSNFVNYLDSEFKMINYSIYDDYFILNLDNSINEEVKYVLAYSIKKNYSTSRIVFENNGIVIDYCFFDLGCVCK